MVGTIPSCCFLFDAWYDGSTSPHRAAFINKNAATGRLYMKLVEYFKETRGEMKHMNWPTRSQGINYTLLVIGISIFTMIVLSVSDYVFSLGLEKFVIGR